MEPNHRRNLIKFLLASPFMTPYLTSCISSSEESRPSNTEKKALSDLIESATEARNVFDFQLVAKSKLPPAHYGYISTGVLDDRTLFANDKAFQHRSLRMRRLMGDLKVDMSTSILGEQWQTPLFICPCGSQKAFHPEGELATAGAARTKGHQMLLSTVSTTGVEDVNKAKGSPVWYQLYPSNHWEDTVSIVKRVEKAGCEVLVLTVDLDFADRRESLEKMIRLDDRDCSSCHGNTESDQMVRKPMVNNLSKPYSFHAGMDWNFVKQLRDTTDMKIIIKGIVAAEDAILAHQAGADGIIVSNHGGRATDSGLASLDCLPEVVKAVDGKIPVMVDGGVRRGADILKALALGASAVGIGRPYLWGLGAFGQEGVETVLELLIAEFELAMKQTGTSSIAQINSSLLA